MGKLTSIELDAIRRECGCELCVPEDYNVAPGTHPGGLRLKGNYPSLRHPPHEAPGKVLLDTCVIQNFSWARSRAPKLDDELGWCRQERRYGRALALELQAVVGLLQGLEELTDDPEEFVPWMVVARASWDEINAAPSWRGEELRAEWRLWRSRAGTFDDFEFVPHPLLSPSPEALRWPGPGQMAMPGVADVAADGGWLGPFVDAGDRRLIREALNLGISAILTTDLRTFWRHRQWLYEHGVEVWRPSDYCWALWNDTLLLNGLGVRPRWPTGSLLATEAKLAA